MDQYDDDMTPCAYDIAKLLYAPLDEGYWFQSFHCYTSYTYISDNHMKDTMETELEILTDARFESKEEAIAYALNLGWNFAFFDPAYFLPGNDKDPFEVIWFTRKFKSLDDQFNYLH